MGKLLNTKNNTLRTAISLVIATSSYAYVGPVGAQVGALEEIVVTARKRSENLQEVPDAITAFSAQTIEDASITNIDSAVILSPNIDIRNDQQPGVYTLSVRGVSTVRNGQPPVAFVVDGVTLPASNSLTQELFDIQQIEILKGPQGALYGRNSIGGAINITTNRPTEEFTGKVKVIAGKGDTYGVDASISGPISESVLYRLSGFYKDTDGLLDNITLGEAADWEKSQGVRGKLLIQPSDEFSADLRVNVYDTDAGSTYYVPLDTAVQPAIFAITQAVAGNFPFEDVPFYTLNQTNEEIIGDHPSSASVESSELSAKLDWDFDFGTLTSITSYNELEEINDQEIDWTESAYLKGVLSTDVEGFTQELRFTSAEDVSLRWFFGAFYQDIDRERGTRASYNTAAEPLAFGGVASVDPADQADVFFNLADELLTQDWTSYAAFGQVNYDLSDTLELTIAVRYDRFETEESQRINDPTGVIAASFDKDTEFTSFQPKVSLAWQLNDDAMAYATIGKGWRPGGFNMPNRIGVTDYDEETLINYELGFKSSWWQNRLTLNGAVYYIDYQEQQFFLLSTNAAGGPVQLIVNGDESTIYGFDLELAAKLTGNLDLNVGLGIVDTELDSISGPIPEQFPGVVPGNKLPNTAESSANVSLQHTFPMSNGLSIISRIDFSRLGKTYWTLDNVQSENAYNLVNLHLSLTDENWRASLVGRNVFEEEYYSQVFDARWTGFVTDVAWPSQPAYYGVEFSLNF